MIESRPPFDFVIRNGRVFDGTGAPPRRADVAVRGDRIAAVGLLDGAGDVPAVDAAGLALAPGFIDSHTHDDQAMFERDACEPKLSQGVTTVVAGNCGISLAPLRLAGEPPAPLNLLGGPGRFRYDGFDQYVAALEASALPMNVAALVGHGTLRVRHLEDWSRPARPDQVQAMARSVAEAMDAGAAGLSTGLAYPTNCAADTGEVVALAAAAGLRGGRLAMHIRDEFDGVAGAVREAFQCARRSGARLVLSHQKVAGEANRGRSGELLRIYREEGEGLDWALDAYPYTAGSTVLDASWLRHARKVLVAWSRPHPEMDGRDLDEICARWGCAPAEAVARLLPAGAVYFHMDEADVARFLSLDRCMVGSDGLPHDQHPHPRLWGAFARVLGPCVRDQGLFPLAEAVRRMTSLPARVFGLRDRGELRAGAFADLVLFDPDRVRDRATYEQPRLPAEGIGRVWVNGRQAWPAPAEGPAGRGRFLPGCGR
jgi:N-acyl-D-aspartate/D-glutamate deacylase